MKVGEVIIIGEIPSCLRRQSRLLGIAANFIKRHGAHVDHPIRFTGPVYGQNVRPILSALKKRLGREGFIGHEVMLSVCIRSGQPAIRLCAAEDLTPEALRQRGHHLVAHS